MPLHFHHVALLVGTRIDAWAFPPCYSSARVDVTSVAIVVVVCVVLTPSRVRPSSRIASTGSTIPTTFTATVPASHGHS